jgi:pyruvate/2-oxoglutarate dehydrogenase complex dihydrolipoamide acyltransferase (E2) component
VARRAIAEHMVRSRQTAAHMTTEAEVDMSAALRAREVLNGARLAAGLPKVSPLALIARACCVALAEFGDLNATFETERLIRWGEINLGVAVDTPQGLMVPVIRGSQRLTAPAIADAVADLAQRARSRALTPDDVRAGTFTISNPGSVGAYSAMAIINQPQVAILGVPMIVRRPAVVLDAHGAESIGIRPLMMLALTFDHRAVDGAYATRAVVRMKTLLETWDASAYG